MVSTVPAPLLHQTPDSSGGFGLLLRAANREFQTSCRSRKTTVILLVPRTCVRSACATKSSAPRRRPAPSPTWSAWSSLPLQPRRRPSRQSVLPSLSGSSSFPDGAAGRSPVSWTAPHEDGRYSRVGVDAPAGAAARPHRRTRAEHSRRRAQGSRLFAGPSR